MTERELAKEKAARLLKKRGSQSTINSEGIQTRGADHSNHHHKYQGSMSTVSHQDEPHHEDMKIHMKFENTYQLTAMKKFPESAITDILRDVLDSYLADEKYEPEMCRKLSKTLSEVIRSRVKELQIPRFKVITLITIGSVNGQGMTVGSRCLWDASVDTHSSYEFKNKHLFAVGIVYGVYAE